MERWAILIACNIETVEEIGRHRLLKISIYLWRKAVSLLLHFLSTTKEFFPL